MALGKMQTIGEALAELRLNPQKYRLVSDWRATIPPDSKWQPGSHGQPACRKCLGLGYLSLDLPRWHPKFGELVFCDCVPQATRDVIGPVIEKMRASRHGR